MTDAPAQTEVTLYTDGACDPNPGPGGWAVLLLFGDHQKTLTGSDLKTTNNRMELQAVISGLEALSRPCRVRLFTDSRKICAQGCNGIPGALEGQRLAHLGQGASGQPRAMGGPDAALQRHAIEWHWVKGHAGDPHNEAVDRLATGMIARPALPTGDTNATHIFAAASCLGAAGPGGWAAVVRAGSDTRELSGRETQTSANRLHLLAVVRGLEALPAGAAAHVYTPSDYVAQGAEHWVTNWARNGWQTKQGQAVKHSELWQAILQARQQRRIQWHCLKNEAARPDEFSGPTNWRAAQRDKGAEKMRAGSGPVPAHCPLSFFPDISKEAR